MHISTPFSLRSLFDDVLGIGCEHSPESRQFGDVAGEEYISKTPQVVMSLKRRL